mgnify:CR=1 FL=1
MDDIDRTFEKLKKADYESLLNLVEDKLTVNPYTFELTLHKLYHHIVTDRGWEVTEFLIDVNRIRYT